MDLYLLSFSELLAKNGFNCNVRSNFEYHNDSFFINFYNYTKPIGIIIVLLNLLKFITKNIFENKLIIYSFYGTFIDIIFIIFLLPKRRVIVDVHEIIELKNSNSKLSSFVKFIFKKSSFHFISHSKKVDSDLKILSNKVICIDHLTYAFSKQYDNLHIDEEVMSLIENEKINLLFFGNLRESKGIKELIHLIKSNESQIKKMNLNFIIAGQDVENIIKNISISIKSASIYCKRFNNDEMKFLFRETDYVLLPYKNVNQSGIMEMSIYFSKKVICSDIEFFNKILSKYPKLGYLFKMNDFCSIFNIIKNLNKKPVPEYGYEHERTKYLDQKNQNKIVNFIKSIK